MGLRAYLGNWQPPSASVYLNNCKYGLHGPIEVISPQAVSAYVNGLPLCQSMHGLSDIGEEDKFMDACLQTVGATRIDGFRILCERACGEEPAPPGAPCMAPKMAFHPFK